MMVELVYKPQTVIRINSELSFAWIFEKVWSPTKTNGETATFMNIQPRILINVAVLQFVLVVGRGRGIFTENSTICVSDY